MGNGYIKLHRSILTCALYDDGKPFSPLQAWIDILLHTNYKTEVVPFAGSYCRVEAGQHLTSYRRLEDRWHWGAGRVKNFLQYLQDQEMITVDVNANGTLLTVINWAFYQNSGTLTDTQIDTPTDTQTERKRNTFKKEKKDKEDKNNSLAHFVSENDGSEKNVSSTDDEAETLFTELWKEYPRKRGKSQVKSSMKKKLLGIGRERCLAAVRRYVAENAGKDEQFFAYGGKFFTSLIFDYVTEDQSVVPSSCRRYKDEMTDSEIGQFKVAGWTEGRDRFGRDYLEGPNVQPI